MFIELIDALRCPVPHEESWLVVAAQRIDARHIVEGTLGCHVCGAEYPIRLGVADFRCHADSVPPQSAPGDLEQAMRLAALLDLSDARGFALLLGDWGKHAALLSSIVQVPLLLVDPPEQVTAAPGISIVRCDADLPLAAGAARATAIDRDDDQRAASAIRATRVQGRVVAPVTVRVPAAVRELTRDQSLWVGEREAPASPLVSLHVRRG